MIHNLIDLVAAGVKGHCDIHGTDSEECGAAKELGDVVIGGLILYSLFKE